MIRRVPMSNEAPTVRESRRDQAIPRPLMAAAAALLLAGSGWSTRAEDASALVHMSLDDLLQVEVTTAGRRSQDLFDVPASVFVMTSEDIRRSGARTLPELLRMVPGVNVARTSAHDWAISVRGFNWGHANKLLVLVDGRSVYSPLSSGVRWDAECLLLEDVERIEVVRGPGGATWGANAVNGVINIITKSAKDTQGTLVVAGIGTSRDELLVRHGWRAASADWRVGLRVDRTDSQQAPGGGSGRDGWDSGRAGFRMDRDLEHGALMVKLDAVRGRQGNPMLRPSLAPPFTQPGAAEDTFTDVSVVARWTRALPTGSVELQVSHDVYSRWSADTHERRGTSDVDLKIERRIGRHHLVWGGALRFSSDTAGGSHGVQLTPEHEDDLIESAFIQDDITLPPAGLHLVVGSKIEHRGTTGLELQPNIRLSWTHRDRHALWAAVSSAARTPSRAERTARVDLAAFPVEGGLVGLVSFFGSADIESEHVVSRELGYRFQARRGLAVDVSLFDASYDGIVSAIAAEPFLEAGESGEAGGHLVLPYVVTNGLDVRSRGVEMLVEWHPSKRVELQFGASAQSLEMREKVAGALALEDVGNSISSGTPRYQSSVRAHFLLREGLTLDAAWQHVARLQRGVGAQDHVDLGIDWRISPHVRLRFDGRHLFTGAEVESGPDLYRALTAPGPVGNVVASWTF